MKGIFIHFDSEIPKKHTDDTRIALSDMAMKIAKVYSKYHKNGALFKFNLNIDEKIIDILFYSFVYKDTNGINIFITEICNEV